MKKIIALLIVICMLSTFMTAFAEANDISVVIDGKTVVFDQAPVIENGRTLVPLRAIFEGLGAVVNWDAETRTVTAFKDTVYKETIVVKLQIDSDTMYVDGLTTVLDVPAKIINDRTMVPVRAISEAFGCDVEWNGGARTVIITPIEHGNRTEKCYFLSGAVSDITEYDSQDRMVKEVVYEENGEFFQMKKYFYLGDGEIQVTEYNSDGTEYTEIVDEYGNIIEY